MLQAEHPASPSLRELAPSPSHCVHLRLARLLARVTMWRVTIPLYKAVRHRVTLAAYTATLPYFMRSRHMLAQCLVVAVGQMNLGGCHPRSRRDELRMGPRHAPLLEARLRGDCQAPCLCLGMRTLQWPLAGASLCSAASGAGTG